MIDHSHALSLARQAQLMQISRGAIYYRRKQSNSEQTQLMHSLDALHLAHPFAGSRMLRGLLQRQGQCVGRRHVRTLMKRMCISALYCKAPHKCSPSAAQDLPVPVEEQIRDACQPSLGHGHYLCAHAQRLDVSLCRARLVQPQGISLATDQHHGGAVLCGCGARGHQSLGNVCHRQHRPEGSQFTSDAFTGLLERHGIRISMDGKGAWRDNVFVERLWRSIKYEEIYLKAYDCVRAARSGIAQYLEFYNSERPHQAHSQATPDEAYFAALPFAQMQTA